MDHWTSPAAKVEGGWGEPLDQPCSKGRRGRGGGPLDQPCSKCRRWMGWTIGPALQQRSEVDGVDHWTSPAAKVGGGWGGPLDPPCSKGRTGEGWALHVWPLHQPVTPFNPTYVHKAEIEWKG